MTAPLPDFADEWIRQWKSAAPKLQAIRDEELRRRGDPQPTDDMAIRYGVRVYDRYPERHGMVTMQQWFTIRHLRETSY